MPFHSSGTLCSRHSYDTFHYAPRFVSAAVCIVPIFLSNGTLGVREAMESYEGFIDLADGFVDNDTYSTAYGFEEDATTASLPKLWRIGFYEPIRHTLARTAAQIQHLALGRITAALDYHSGRYAPTATSGQSAARSISNRSISLAQVAFAVNSSIRKRMMDTPCALNGEGHRKGCFNSVGCECASFERCYATRTVKESQDKNQVDPGVCAYSVVVLVVTSLILMGSFLVLFIMLRVFVQWRERVANLYAARRAGSRVPSDLATTSTVAAAAEAMPAQIPDAPAAVVQDGPSKGEVVVGGQHSDSDHITF